MPQEGPQELFLSLQWVDIIVYGGGAGSGKSYGLCLDPLSNIQDEGFGGVFFRRESPQIMNEGGLWDTSGEIYPYLGARPKTSPPARWTFPNGTTLTFTHLNNEEDKFSHQGGQYPWIGFDELTHFTETQVWYLISRNRSGRWQGRPRVRATTNPDAGSWVKWLLAPWVDDDYSDKAASGEIRWLVRDAKEHEKNPAKSYHYFREKQEAEAFAMERFPELTEELAQDAVKSVTFIEADLWDNPILMQNNPQYLANLLAQGEVERERLLYKNWNILTGRFFDKWRPSKADGSPWHVIPTGPVPKGVKCYLCVDWGFSDPFACYLMAVEHTRRAILCREIYETRLGSSDQGERMVELITANGLRLQDVIVYCGHDVFNRRLNPETGQYEEPIVFKWIQKGLQCVSSGRDPVNRAETMRTYLDDWGPDELWPNGRPGLQVMSCCSNFIRTLPLLLADEKHPEQVDTTLEDHAYDAVGHMMTSAPAPPEPPKREEVVADTRKKGSVARRLGITKRKETEEYTI